MATIAATTIGAAVPLALCRHASLAPSDWPDSSDQRDWNDPIESSDIDEPSDPIEANEATDPIDNADPDDPMLSTDSVDAMLSTELRDPTDNTDAIPTSCPNRGRPGDAQSGNASASAAATMLARCELSPGCSPDTATAHVTPSGWASTIAWVFWIVPVWPHPEA